MGRHGLLWQYVALVALIGLISVGAVWLLRPLVSSVTQERLGVPGG